MTNVTDRDRNEMSRLLNIMEGKIATTSATGESLPTTDVAANVDVAAMGDILRRLNSVTDKVSETLITESNHNTDTAIALQTSVNDQGVKIGLYQIQIA